MTQHDYKAVLEALNEILTYEDAYHFIKYHRRAIHQTLLIADKLMQEPSAEMLQCLMQEWDSTGGRTMPENYKAMRDQLLREVGE